MRKLTEIFVEKHKTFQPQSHGINFVDVYLDDEMHEKPKSPINNCYVNIPYRYNIGKTYMTVMTVQSLQSCNDCTVIT